MAQHQQSFAANQAKALNDAVCYQTDIQYWSAVARQEIVTVAEDFRNSIAALVKTIKERVEAGLVDPQDLLMAEVKLNEAEYQLLQAQSNFETGRMALNSMIGVRLEHHTELDSQIPVVVVDDSTWLSTGMARPEIQMAYDRIRMAESTKKLNDSQFKPQFYVGRALEVTLLPDIISRKIWIPIMLFMQRSLYLFLNGESVKVRNVLLLFG